MKELSILGLGNIGRMFIKEAIIKKNIVKNILVRKIKKYDVIYIKKILKKKIFITKKYKKLIFVKNIIEVIGGEKIFKIVKKIIKKNKTETFITANKNLVSKNYKKLIKISKKNNTNFGYEASVGGGMPIIKNLIYINFVKFNKIVTIINGTTNYILTCLFEKHLNKKQAFLKARSKGFAEKNITFDVKGIDIAYKLNIIISIVYKCYIDIKKISIEGLIFPCKKNIYIIKKENFLIKYIGIIVKKKNIICVSVFPILIKRKSICNIKYEYNCILLKSKKFGDLFIKAKGAGKYPTSVSIISDLKINLKNKLFENSFYISDRISKNKIFIIIKKKRIFKLLLLNKFKIKNIKQVDNYFLIKTREFLDKKRVFFFKKNFCKDFIIRIE